MKFFLMALVKKFRKEMGRSPNPGELNSLKKTAKDMEMKDKSNVIKFPEGGKDKVNPFEDRPTKKRITKETSDTPFTDMVQKEVDGVKLYGDETFAELDIIRKTGKHPRGEPKAQGGIIGLANGGPSDPSRRRFMKILGGLAAIPVLGRFIKPIEQVAPVATETAKVVPSYFFKLVDKIKRLGDDDPGLTTTPRETGKRYKDYELVEDLNTGDIVIKKRTEGGATVGDESFETIDSEEVMIYRAKQKTETGTLPEDYEELTAKPSYPDGDLDDVEDGLDNLDEILNEVGEKRAKQAGGGIAYLLGE